MKHEVPVFYPESLSQWRKWLERNHATETSVWVVFYNKASGKPSLTWSEAVDVALCYGWIDSKKVSVDAERAHQFFSRRKLRSTWSKINKEKVERLLASGQMHAAGLAVVEAAKANGSWSLLDDVEELVVPPDLAAAFRRQRGSKAFFQTLSRSTRKAMLQWLVLARRPETRQARIQAIATLAAEGKKPKGF